MVKITRFSDSENLPPLQTERDIEETVATQLRRLRDEKGLSLRALAARSGLNVNTLSLIERGKSSPSVGTLQQLARALDVPTSIFLEEKTAESAVVYIKNGCCPTTRFGENMLYHLGAGLKGNQVQPYLMSVQPGSGSGDETSVHTGHEFIFCMQGHLHCQIEDEHFDLNKGDSILFEAHLPHRWLNQTVEETRILVLFCPADIHELPGATHFDI